MPSEWTTPEQKAFLMEELVVFKHIGSKHYTKHWPTLFRKWSEKWPKRLTALPGIPDDAELADQQKETLTVAISKRHKQLRAWMHWHAGARQNRSVNSKTTSVVNALLKPKTRIKKPWEIYSKHYFSLRIQPTIPAGTPIAEVNKKIRQLFEDESAEIKEEIHALYEQQKQGLQRQRSHDKEGESDKSDDVKEDVKLDPSVIRRYGLQHTNLDLH